MVQAIEIDWYLVVAKVTMVAVAMVAVVMISTMIADC